MAIEQEKIVSNIKKYFDTANKIGFMTDKLAELLGEEFMKAPASHMADYHNSFSLSYSGFNTHSASLVG